MMEVVFSWGDETEDGGDQVAINCGAVPPIGARMFVQRRDAGNYDPGIWILVKSVSYELRYGNQVVFVECEIEESETDDG